MANTILVVDDEPSIRNILKIMFTKKDVPVITAKDGEEAIKKYLSKSDEINFVITDVVMPRMSGYELALRLLEQDSHLPILFISGYNSSKEIQNLVNVNENVGYISKPFGVDEIINMMKKLTNT